MKRAPLLTILISAAVSAIVSFGASTFILKSRLTPAAQPTGEAASAYVKQAMLDDPGMMDDVFLALQAAREQDRAANAQASIEAVKPALYSDKRDQTIGPMDAKFTLIEFFDYNCGYCKQAAVWTKKQLETHPDEFRIIFKDLPLLEGRVPGSREASLAADAVWKQGADIFTNFHFAMMAADGGFDSQRIDEIAGEAGVDVEQMRADMIASKNDFEVRMSDTFALADALAINGTPAFIADGILVSGANTPLLQQILDDKLEES